MIQKVVFYICSNPELCKKNLLLAVIVMVSITAQAQWKWLNPKPSGYHNTKITFTDNNTRDQLITLPAAKLLRGIYLLYITDLQTKKMITRKLVKVQ